MAGAPEASCRFSGSFEGRRSVFGSHGQRRLNVGQTAAGGSSQYSRGRRFLVREFADDQPVMTAERQVPAYEFAATALEQIATDSSRFSGLASMPLTASVVNLPREM